MDHKSKYLKYKQKYLELQKQLGGSLGTPDNNTSMSSNKLVELYKKYINPNYNNQEFSTDLLNKILLKTICDPTDIQKVKQEQDFLIQSGANLTSIGNNAFEFISDFAGENYQLTSAIIPPTVTTIGNYAFYSNFLLSIEIPDSVTSIGIRAFADNKLHSVILGKSVKSIGQSAFANNKLKDNLTIPNGVTSIGTEAFYNNKLRSVKIPDTITLISEGVFARNELDSVTIPNGVISIGERAFADNNLTEIDIPNSVKSIGDNAFTENMLRWVYYTPGFPIESFNAFDSSPPPGFLPRK